MAQLTDDCFAFNGPPLPVAEAEKLMPLLEAERMSTLATALAKIDRYAKVAGYCIFNIADMT